MFELLGCEIGVLQGDRRQADEPVRLCRADIGEFLILQFDDLTGEVGVGLGPKIGLRLSASMSIPCSSITVMRSGEITSDCGCTFNPISAFASGT